ncbi:hypothetical protein [Salinimicrobium sediminilitoris]|uniref:hypothetical protein n=1 Tax=Salinimicrobium sediminilitoris TaxID=2876715 RepID=UPI001E317B09|nr:hypothetical protein [Salinimicrobium sediminilitoris]MCC8360605.1 hypothetical protein [Salinimicrobium sediminilitoris]
MENHEYSCHYCGKYYVPRRRFVQKYCCTSCRVNAFKRRIKPASTEPSKGLSLPQKEMVKNEPKISLAGVGNAAIANVVTDFAKSALTREEDKPLTKGEFRAYTRQQPQERYHPVYNVPHRNDGTSPFYDTTTKHIVYLKQLKKWQ